MVFIQSQEYTDSFGKPSKNIICLEGQTDYKISHNPETNKFDVRIVMGDYEKYIFSGDNEEQSTRILQNIFTHHSKNNAFAIFDVEAFMVPEVEEETTLEEIEELIANILEFHGYKNVVEAWDTKIDELYIQQQGDPNGTSPIMENEKGEMCVDKIEVVESNLLHPITSYEKPSISTASIEQRYIHYN